jgi:hypothetical protein
VLPGAAHADRHDVVAGGLSLAGGGGYGATTQELQNAADSPGILDRQ